MTPDEAKALREPFPPEAIGQLPRAGMKLDFVGHAAVTDRLLAVDPDWTWEPFAVAADGGPLIRYGEKEASLWLRLTVAGVTRPGVGIASVKADDLEKQLISDGLRNAAMRFGVALDLWSRENLHEQEPPSPVPPSGFESMDEAKATVDALRALVIDLDLTRWIRDQHFNWPWDKRTCDAIAAKCAIREEELAAPFEPVNEDGTPAPTLLEEKPKGKKVDTGRAAEETAAL